MCLEVTCTWRSATPVVVLVEIRQTLVERTEQKFGHIG